MRRGYICPMDLTFREALDHAMRATGNASLRQVATGAGVSYDILKNVRQGKSEKPNPEAAIRVARFFGVSLEDFYRGRVEPGRRDSTLEADKERLRRAILDLSDEVSVEKVADYVETILLAEQARRQTR